MAAQGIINEVVYDKPYFKTSIKIDTSIDAPTVVFVYRSGKGEPLYAQDFAYELSGPAGTDNMTTASVVGNQLIISVGNKALDG